MQAYKFALRISETGMITLPSPMSDLYGKEAEIFIIVSQEEKNQEKIKPNAQQFVSKWAGFLKKENIKETDIENAKYEYLSEKYK